MGDDIPDIGPRVCCLWTRRYDQNGPWTCGECGLMHGWPCAPMPAACVPDRDINLARQIAEAHVALRADRPFWFDLVCDGVAAAFAIDWSES